MLWDIVSFMVELVSLVHVDEMVEEKKSHSFSVGTAHNPANLEGNSRRFSYFTSAKQMAVF
jgi:hypothetical protein